MYGTHPPILVRAHHQDIERTVLVCDLPLQVEGQARVWLSARGLDDDEPSSRLVASVPDLNVVDAWIVHSDHGSAIRIGASVENFPLIVTDEFHAGFESYTGFIQRRVVAFCENIDLDY